MSRWGVAGSDVTPSWLYAGFINRQCDRLDFPPALAYAIAVNETIAGEAAGEWNAATVQSGDGGWGLFQLTSYHPDNWQDPSTNCYYAVTDWLLPDANRWFQEFRVTGDDLIRCVAASFNAGWGNAVAAHNAGNVDAATTDNYASRALDHYHAIIAGNRPY